MLFIVPVFIIGTVNTLFTKDSVDLKLTSHYNVVYCQKDLPKNEVLVTVGVGNLAPKDSLYAFNFKANYDSNKLKFENMIKINTLTEYAKYVEMGFGKDKGSLNASAMSFDVMYGNRDLIGFHGRYIGDICQNDSAFVTMDYIEFTDEFQKVVRNMDTLWIKPFRYENPNSKLIFNFDKDELVYDTINTNIVKVSTNLDGLQFIDELGFDVSFTKPEYKLTITNIDTTEFKLISLEYSPDKTSASIKIRNNGSVWLKQGIFEIFDVEIFKNNSEEDTTTKLIVNPIKLSDCNCVNYDKIVADSLSLKNYKLSSISQIDDKINVKYINNILQIENLSLIKSIQLFNSVGVSVSSKKNINSLNYVETLKLRNGIYLVLIETDNKIEKRIIIVNN